MIKFLKTLNKGTYSTFDILEKYQGIRDRNEGKCSQQAWNANFGKVLKQCADDPTAKVIKLLERNHKITINGGSTTTAIWEIY